VAPTDLDPAGAGVTGTTVPVAALYVTGSCDASRDVWKRWRRSLLVLLPGGACAGGVGVAVPLPPLPPLPPLVPLVPLATEACVGEVGALICIGPTAGLAAVAVAVMPRLLVVSRGVLPAVAYGVEPVLVGLSAR
jgi:hypothetical protein